MRSEEKKWELVRLVHLAVGAASMCWDIVPSGGRDSEEIGKVGKKLVKEIESLFAERKLSEKKIHRLLVEMMGVDDIRKRTLAHAIATEGDIYED